MLFFKLIIYGIPLLSLGWWVWADRRLAGLGVMPGWRIIVGLAMLLLLAGFVLVILDRRDVVNFSIPTSLYAAVLLWGLLFLPFLALPSMLGWSIWSVGKQVHKLVSDGGKPAPKTNGEEIEGGITRRQLLAAAAVTFPVIATFGTAAISMPQTRRFRIRPITVYLKELPEALDGMRIAHVTDTHVGKFTHGEMLNSIADATNRLNSDLVLLTGDLIDNTLEDLPAAIAMVKRIDPRSGLFMVEGNHDLFDNPAEFVRAVRAEGIPLLRNQAETVYVRGQKVQILGIPWNHSERQMAEDVATVAKLRQPDAFQILLAHHPHAFDPAVEAGIPLTLAGHTHGGQLMLTPNIGAGPAMFKYWSGLYQKDGRALVVSNGVGNWFPLRTFAPAEIIDLTLRRG